MDPNAALKACREAAKDLATEEGHVPPAAAELEEHFQALDEWLSHGGFPPEAWARPEPNGMPDPTLDQIGLLAKDARAELMGTGPSYRRRRAAREKLEEIVGLTETP